MPRSKAYAKLNLTLDITGKRSDGYHTLDSIFHTVSLFDTVWLEPADKITVSYRAALPTGSQCIARKAAERFFAASGIKGGADIKIIKNIPMEAGLGGGSSDAAAVLKLLNQVYGNVLSKNKLFEIAPELGADVAFFLAGGTQRAKGIGEKLERLDVKKNLWFVIVKPEKGLSTRDVYDAYDRISPNARPTTDKAAAALQAGDIGAFAKAAANVLEAAAVNMVPEIAAIKTMHYSLSALYSAMTGSGSAVFGIYPGKPAAQAAASAIEKRYKCCYCVCSVPATSCTAE